MLKSSLLGRTYQIEGGWYAPESFLSNFKSVKMLNLWNTTSSAGDWQGWMVQKLDKNYLVMWSQDNNYPRGGFTLNIDEKPIASWSRNVEISKDEIEKIIAERENELMELDQLYQEWLDKQEEERRQKAFDEAIQE